MCVCVRVFFSIGCKRPSNICLHLLTKEDWLIEKMLTKSFNSFFHPLGRLFLFFRRLNCEHFLYHHLMIGELQVILFNYFWEFEIWGFSFVWDIKLNFLVIFIITQSHRHSIKIFGKVDSFVAYNIYEYMAKKKNRKMDFYIKWNWCYCIIRWRRVVMRFEQHQKYM